MHAGAYGRFTGLPSVPWRTFEHLSEHREHREHRVWDSGMKCYEMLGWRTFEHRNAIPMSPNVGWPSSRVALSDLCVFGAHVLM